MKELDTDIVIATAREPSTNATAVSANVVVDERQMNALFLDVVRVSESYGLKFPREFALLLKQLLYFDRYTCLLAPKYAPGPKGYNCFKSKKATKVTVPHLASSFSPTIPHVVPIRLNMIEKTLKRMKPNRRYVRSLWPHAGDIARSRIWKINNAGFFHLKLDTPQEDINLFNFIFTRTSKIEVETRFNEIVVAKHGGVNLSRADLACLGHRELVSSDVINLFAHYLNEEGSPFWFFPTYFYDNSVEYPGFREGDYEKWVDLTKSMCSLSRFTARIANCQRIFIPMHEGTSKEAGHRYLLVVRPKDNLAEIWDSCPREMYYPERFWAATQMMLHLDDVLEKDMHHMTDAIDFASFKCEIPTGNNVQNDDRDSGVYVIRNMQYYGQDWASGYEAGEHRVNLVLECLKSHKNQVLNVGAMVDDYFRSIGI